MPRAAFVSRPEAFIDSGYMWTAAGGVHRLGISWPVSNPTQAERAWAASKCVGPEHAYLVNRATLRTLSLSCQAHPTY